MVALVLLIGVAATLVVLWGALALVKVAVSVVLVLIAVLLFLFLT